MYVRPDHPAMEILHMNVATSRRVTAGDGDYRGQEEGKDRTVEWEVSRLNSVTLWG